MRVWLYSFLSCKNLVSHPCPYWVTGIRISTFIYALVVSQIFITKKKSHIKGTMICQGFNVSGTQFLFFNVQCQGRNDNCINLKIEYQITIANEVIIEKSKKKHNWNFREITTSIFFKCWVNHWERREWKIVKQNKSSSNETKLRTREKRYKYLRLPNKLRDYTIEHSKLRFKHFHFIIKNQQIKN